jgi:hypothetical protein
MSFYRVIDSVPFLSGIVIYYSELEIIIEAVGP